MNPTVRQISGRMVILERSNLDTDQIIPARFLRNPRERGPRDFLFHDLRRHCDGSLRVDFSLNAPAAREAPILLTGPNFGCGSAREGAVYALLDSGVRAVLAPSFGDIFKANALQNSLLPVELPNEADRLIALVRADPAAECTVDLETQAVLCASLRLPFRIDPFDRERLLLGLDETELTLSYQGAIREFEIRHLGLHPWIGVNDGS